MFEELLHTLQYNQLFFQHKKKSHNLKTKSIIPTIKTIPNPIPSEIIAFCISSNSRPNRLESEALKSRLEILLLQVETFLLESETLLLQSATLRLQIETFLLELKKLRSQGYTA